MSDSGTARGELRNDWEGFLGKGTEGRLLWYKTLASPAIDVKPKPATMSTLTEGCSVYSDVYELSSVPATPTTTGSEKGILHSVAGTSEPDSSVNIQQLPPVDGGHQAWLFCFASFILEMLVWGFGFRYRRPTLVVRSVLTVFSAIVTVSSRVSSSFIYL